MELKDNIREFWAALEYCYSNTDLFNSQKALSIAAGVRDSTTSEQLRKKKGCDVSTQSKIAAAFGYDLLDFLNIGRDLLDGISLDESISLVGAGERPPIKSNTVSNASPIPTENNVIEFEHQGVVRDFKDKKRALAANKDLRAIEEIDYELFVEAVGVIRGLRIAAEKKAPRSRSSGNGKS